MGQRVVRSLKDLLRHGMDLDVECRCGHKSKLDTRAVYRRFSAEGWSTSLAGAFFDSPFRHFRCSKCGARPSHIGPWER